MSRFVCFAILSAGLVAASGCSSCFGGGTACRRPSFLDFRAPCSSGPMAAPMQQCAPVCAPACEPAHGTAAPCCEGGTPVVSAPVTVS